MASKPWRPTENFHRVLGQVNQASTFWSAEDDVVERRVWAHPVCFMIDGMLHQNVADAHNALDDGFGGYSRGLWRCFFGLFAFRAARQWFCKLAWSFLQAKEGTNFARSFVVLGEPFGKLLRFIRDVFQCEFCVMFFVCTIVLQLFFRLTYCNYYGVTLMECVLMSFRQTVRTTCFYRPDCVWLQFAPMLNYLEVTR